jgi:hypothetical protein
MRASKFVFQSTLLIVFSLGVSHTGFSQTAKDSNKPSTRSVIWRNPGTISQRALRYGPGSPEMVPVAPFTFLEEDKSGESPQTSVVD